MLIDTNLTYSRSELAVAFRELRMCYYASNDVFTYNIIKHKQSNAVAYYLDAETLFNRICDIANVSATLIKTEKKHTLRPIIWSIMISFGHPEREIKKLFGHSIRSTGLSTYYRKKMVYHMTTKPFYVKQYDEIVKIIEQDREELA